MRRALVVASLASLTGCGTDVAPRMTISPHCDRAGHVGVAVGEQRYEPLDDPGTLKRLKAKLGSPDTPLHLQTDTQAELPYRCIGGVIFALQRLGYRKVDFIAEPASKQ